LVGAPDEEMSNAGMVRAFRVSLGAFGAEMLELRLVEQWRGTAGGGGFGLSLAAVAIAGRGVFAVGQPFASEDLPGGLLGWALAEDTKDLLTTMLAVSASLLLSGCCCCCCCFFFFFFSPANGHKQPAPASCNLLDAEASSTRESDALEPVVIRGVAGRDPALKEPSLFGVVLAAAIFLGCVSVASLAREGPFWRGFSVAEPRGAVGVFSAVTAAWKNPLSSSRDGRCAQGDVLLTGDGRGEGRKVHELICFSPFFSPLEMKPLPPVESQRPENHSAVLICC
jgi:hypothetical protein